MQPERKIQLPTPATMKATVIAGALLLALSSCRHEGPADHVVDRAAFVRLYCDLLHNAERVRGWGQDSIAARSYADSVLARAGITNEQFEATLQWYNEDVRRWQEFSQEVIRTLETPAPTTPPPR